MLQAKKLKDMMCGSQQKTKQNKTKQKTSILGQKDKFRTVFSQNGENDLLENLS